MADQILTKSKISIGLGTFEFEGDQAFVEKQIEKVTELMGSNPIPVPLLTHTLVASGGEEKNGDGIKKKKLVEDPKTIPDLIKEKEKILDLKKFMELKKPQGHQEIFTTLTYWLKMNLGLQDVSIDEMWSLYKILGIKAPKNLIQVFRDVKSKKAWFDGGSAVGKYKLTPSGEMFIEHDLPKKA
jgi:hypothetical protein